VATYKKPCIHCGAMVEGDARYCYACGSQSPFGYNCPYCLQRIGKEQACCSSCGRALYIACPYCNGRTFVQTACETCGRSLLITCPNRRCQQPQFFQANKCTACGKKIKDKERTQQMQITAGQPAQTQTPPGQPSQAPGQPGYPDSTQPR